MRFSPKEKVIYIGHEKIKLKYDKGSDFLSLISAINFLQANMEYIYSIVGHEVEPFLIANNELLGTLRQNNF